MKILIADRFSQDAQVRLKRSNFDVIYDPDLQGDSLKQAIGDTMANVLVVRSTRVTADALNAGYLSLVIRAGAGYNTIDVKTAEELGIWVANCPGTNANAVAELAFGLMISLDRHIPDNVLDLREGRYNKIGYSSALGLYGKTLGLIGVGRIGQAMIPRARAFGMPVIAWSRSLTPQRADELDIAMMDSPLEVAASADIVSVHVALTDETNHLVDAGFLNAMRPGAMLINTSRAEVVDEAALARAVTERGIRAGVDVFEGEPTTGTGAVENELFKLKGVIGTHHIGGATKQAHDAIADETVRIICQYRDTGIPPNVVR
jgi:D-3-phosphoglycerate dehydrogenase